MPNDSSQSQTLASWNRFWHTPEPASTLALVRIALGLLTVVWLTTLAPNLSSFFGSRGILPIIAGPPGSWSMLFLSGSQTVVGGLFAATLVGALLLTVGLWTRLAAFVVFICMTSFQRSNPDIMNSGDNLLRILILFCALAPSGRALSLDRLRSTATDKFWEFPLYSPWALRLIQIQISIGYWFAAINKMSGATWRNGTAVYYVLHYVTIDRVHLPVQITDSLLASHILSYGTLLVEFAIALLVWNRKLRPWVLATGVILHVSIDYCIQVGLFSWILLGSYLAFVPPETASEWLFKIRSWLAKAAIIRSWWGRLRPRRSRDVTGV